MLFLPVNGSAGFLQLCTRYILYTVVDHYTLVTYGSRRETTTDSFEELGTATAVVQATSAGTLDYNTVWMYGCNLMQYVGEAGIARSGLAANQLLPSAGERPSTEVEKPAVVASFIITVGGQLFWYY